MSPIGPEQQKERLWIFAGRHEEFITYRHQLGEHYDCRYIADEQSVRGHRDGKFVCLGSWFSKPDSIQICHYLRAAGFQEIGFSKITGEEVKVQYNDGKLDYLEDSRLGNKIVDFYISEEEFKI
jgi:hypothetical protein